MRPSRRGPLTIGLPVLAAAVLFAASPSAFGESLDRVPEATVLVELFTSQGCSSCPAADRLLSRISQAAPQGATVVPLAFHVDYWNYIGWSDPFSSPDWSSRQRDYARRLASRSVYTPQLVVNGRWDAVGSDEREVRQLIRRAHGAGARGAVAIEARRAGAGRVDLRLTARAVDARGPSSARPATRETDLVLWLAVVESGFETPVLRGENVHKTLRNDHVVRRLLPALELGARGDGMASVRLDLEPGWAPENLSFAAFVQDRATMRVGAAASTRLAD